MQFIVWDMKRKTSSGSLQDVVTQIEYGFQDSGSGIGSDSGSTYWGMTRNLIDLQPAESSGFTSFSSITKEKAEIWIANAYVTQSSIEGSLTASLWNEHTASMKTNISNSIAQQQIPQEKNGLPW